MTFGGFVLALLLCALVGVLAAGVALMGAGGSANLKYGNKLMVARVWLQGLSLLVLVLIVFSTK